MRTLSILTLMCVLGCGATPTGNPLVLRWPSAPPVTCANWKASQVRWRAVLDDVAVQGPGPMPAVIPWTQSQSPARIRVELWLADTARPEVTWPTFVGEGSRATGVRLRLADRRWALTPASP